MNQEFINYRINQAFETLSAAKVLIANKYWNSSVNRLYYACFYAITALLLKHGITAKTHTAIKSQFSLQYIHNTHVTFLLQRKKVTKKRRRC